MEGFGRVVQTIFALFYADDVILKYPQPSMLQAALGVFMGLFNCVGIQINFGKTVGMTCKSCHTSRSLTEVSYTRSMTGVGPSYQEHHMEKTQFQDCGADL